MERSIVTESTDANPFALDPTWRAATDRIIKMMETGIVSSAPLPTGPASTMGIERYARAVCDTNPQADLGVMYGLISVATCIAAQGAYTLKVPIRGGGWLDVPCIQYFIGIAPSGWRKSTALDVARRPLKTAIAYGEHLRRKELPRLRSLAEMDAGAQIPVGKTLDPKQFAKVFNAGLCPVTLVKDPTVEGTRDLLVQNGGVAAVLAGEADVFRNVGAYAPDQAGSLTFILDGWSQDDIATMRVGRGMLVMDEAALFMGVLFQTDVFASVTSGSARGGVGSGDSYQERGMFGRFWVVEAARTDGWAEAASDYADDAPWDIGNDSDGMTDMYGNASPLGLALRHYRDALHDLVGESNSYRMHKALRHAWLNASSEYGSDLQVPEIDQKPRTELRLDHDPAALAEYNRIQRMYHALAAYLADADPDVQALWEPMISRFVQHVLREALTVTLAAGQRVITAEILRDCALRIFPWRMGLSAAALTRRNNDRIDMVIAESFNSNREQLDLDVPSKVVKVMAKMLSEAGGEHDRSLGWTRTEIVRRCTSTIPKASRRGVGQRIREALDQLLHTPGSGIIPVEPPPDADKSWTDHYTITAVAAAAHRR